MIGNPKWFSLRKYTGWGLTPNCWQGWFYILFFILPIVLINYLPIEQNIKSIFSIVVTAIIIADIVHIMSQIKKDERERLHEAIADRNALWFIIFVFLASVFIRQTLDPIIIIVLVGATLVKALTWFYLRDK